MTEYGGVLQKGGGPFEYQFPPGEDQPKYPVPTFYDPSKDLFADGSTVQRRIGYEIDWDLLKEWAWEDRFLLSTSILTGCVIGAALYDPARYAPLVDALGRAIAGAIQGIGGVVPG